MILAISSTQTCFGLSVLSKSKLMTRKAVFGVLLLSVLASYAFGQAGTSTLPSGGRLNEGQRLVSPKGTHYLVVQADGNLCVYTSANAFVWASMVTQGKGSYLTMQTDGNLAMNDRNGKAVWSTKTQAFFDAKYGTPERKPVRAVLGDDGALGLFTAANKQVWSSAPSNEGYAGPTTKRDLSVALPFAKAQKLPVEVANDGTVIFQRDMVVGKVSDFTKSAPPSYDAKSWLWPKSTIPYVIQVRHGKRDLILEGIKEINGKTNLCLVPRTVEKDYVEFVSRDGHWSNVGQVGGRQEISIDQTVSYVPVGTVAHEIMHAAGFNHTQSRENRDGHVTINLRNVVPGMEGNFVKLTDKSSNIGAYDFGSLMHYPSAAFAINTAINTINLRAGGDATKMGQRDALSAGDVASIATVYPPAPCKSTDGKSPTISPTLVTPPASAKGAAGNNIAIGKKAYQSVNSGTLGGFDAGKAIDGNTDGRLGQGSVTNTGEGTYLWWEVDLGAVYNVDRIVVWNRTDEPNWRWQQNFGVVTGTEVIRTRQAAIEG